jgi:hypothetical protein
MCKPFDIVHVVSFLGASELECITPPVYMPSLLQHRKEVTGLQLQLDGRIVSTVMLRFSGLKARSS